MEFGIYMCTQLYFKWITNRDLVYIAQGTLLNFMWQPEWEGGLGENGYMYIHMAESFAVHLKPSQHC